MKCGDRTIAEASAHGARMVGAAAVVEMIRLCGLNCKCAGIFVVVGMRDLNTVEPHFYKRRDIVGLLIGVRERDDAARLSDDTDDLLRRGRICALTPTGCFLKIVSGKGVCLFCSSTIRRVFSVFSKLWVAKRKFLRYNGVSNTSRE